MTTIPFLQTAPLSPVTFERWVYALRQSKQIPSDVIAQLRAQDATFLLPSSLKLVLPPAELKFFEWISRDIGLGLERVLAASIEDAQWVAGMRERYVKKNADLAPSFPSLDAWLQAERMSWLATGASPTQWANTSEAIESTYFWPMMLLRHMPGEDVDFLLSAAAKRRCKPRVVIEEFFLQPKLIAPLRHLTCESPEELMAIATTKAAEPATEEVRFNLDVKLVRLLQAIADYQGTTLDEVVKMFVIRGVTLSVSSDYVA